MKILKRNGEVQEFIIDKIITSVENSAEDISYTLTDSEKNIIIKDINSLLNKLRGNDGYTSSYEVRGVIYQVLLEDKFESICKSYMNI